MSELGLFHHPTLSATARALAGSTGSLAPPLRQTFQDGIERLADGRHGDFPRWQAALQRLPELDAPRRRLGDRVTVDGPATAQQRSALHAALRALHPWRKGPFRLYGVDVDTEWRSDWKWQRLHRALRAAAIDMRGAQILDVGCGNGYFGWRMLGAGAAHVLGIDPTLLFCLQHLAVNRYLRSDRNWVLPLRLEDLPTHHAAVGGFDLVLSLGVIYHRRDPDAHIATLGQLVRPGGALAIESLVVDDDPALAPAATGARYARMRNVWYVPTAEALAEKLVAAGWEDVRLASVVATTTAEQRATAWMRFESLRQALDPAQQDRTVEGWPAPRRALLTARWPGPP